MLVKRIKNNDGVSREWSGQEILSGSYYTITPEEELYFINDSDLIADITSGVAVINDGVSDLNVADGLRWLRYIEESAKTYFDNSNFYEGVPSNTYSATSLDQAVPEGRIWKLNSVPDVDAPSPNDGDSLAFEQSSGNWVPVEVDTDTKEVKVSSNDTTPKFLYDAIDAGQHISKTVLFEGADEKLKLDIDLDFIKGDVPYVNRYSTTTFTIDLAWQDVTFDALCSGSPNFPDSLEDEGTTRIRCKEAGVVYIGYKGAVDADASDEVYEFRIVKNGVDVLPASILSLQDDFDRFPVAWTLVCMVEANDYLTVQIRQATGATSNDTPFLNAAFWVSYGKGYRGETGYGIYAFAKTDTDGTNLDARNLTVSRTGTGTYEYTFITEAPNANYTVAHQLFNLGTNTDTNIFINNVTASGFTLTIGEGDNSTTADVLTDAEHSVTIFGPQGPDGLTNTYDIWLDLGNSGTQQDFVDSLQGVTGLQGIQGNTGVRGFTGITGFTGLRGIQGVPGSGSSIVIEEEDTPVPNTPHTTLNFIGAEVTDGGSGQADIEINEVSLIRNFYVAKNGNDTTGNGTLSKPFLSIGACITYINSNYTLSASNNAIILVAAGEYTENTLALPRFCSLSGQGYRTRVSASAGNIDLITSIGAHTIKGMILTGVTDINNYLINISTAQATRVTLEDISFSTYEAIGDISNAVYVNSTSGTVTVRCKKCDFNNITDNIITLDNNVQFIVNVNQVFENCSTATYIDANNNCGYYLENVNIDDCHRAIDHKCGGDSEISSSDLRGATHPFTRSNTGNITVRNTHADTAGMEVTSYLNIHGYFLDEIEGDKKLQVLDEFAVGVPGQGKESCFGEGDSYSLGSFCYQYDGSTFTDISNESRSIGGSPFSFPTSGTTREIYFTTSVLTSGTTTPVEWLGIKASILTAASADGEIVIEYWNGSSWIEFTHMSTESSGNYFPYAMDLFERIGSEQIRFQHDIQEDWVSNDPVGLGNDYNWVRFRLETVPTTLPVFEQWKVHSNRTEINADGWMEYFGEARPVESVGLPAFESANNSPNNQDLYLQDNFGIGYRENEFENGTTDAAGSLIYLPASVDTSCPLLLNIVMTQGNGTGGTQSDWVIRWAIVPEDENLYFDTIQSPTSNPIVQEKNVSIVTPSTLTESFTLEVLLDISGYRSRVASSFPDKIAVQIQRNGGTDACDGNIATARVQVFYTKWCNGGH